MTNQRKPQAKTAERLSRPRQRQKLIDACISALYQHGPSRTTIDKVVAIADMSPGIVNFYFETKAALLIAALEYLAVEFEETVLAPLAAMREQPVQALDRLVELYLDPVLASARKVSVWYSFWGESSSRREYYTICGKRDVAFAALVRDLVARLIRQTGSLHLDADAVALGLIGALEIMWQEIAFQDESVLDRASCRLRCRAYLRSVFPGQFGQHAAPEPARGEGAGALPRAAYFSAAVLEKEMAAIFRGQWLWLCCLGDLPETGCYVTVESAADRLLVVRDLSGKIQVFQNRCRQRPHAIRETPEGRFADAIRCEADGTAYGWDGLEASGAVRGGLTSVAARIDGDAICLASGSRDVPLCLPPLTPVGRWQSTDLPADWKLVVEHWAACLAAQTAGALFEIAEEGMTQTINMHDADRIPSGTLYLRLLEGDIEAVTDPHISHRLIWPNLFVESRPDGVTIQQVLPLGPGECRVRLRHYTRGIADRAARARCYLAERLARAARRTALQAAASASRGLAWSAGEPDAACDPALAAFWEWLRRANPGGYVK